MKKIQALFVAVVLCFSLAGCIELEDFPEKELADQSDDSSTPSKQELSFGLNETAVFDNLKFTATELVENKGNSIFDPEDGNIFVGIKFTIENVSNEEQSVSTLLLFDGYADDIKCEYSFSANCAFDEGTLDGDIAPGKKLVGWYAMEVPKDWTSIELEVLNDWLSNNSAKFVFTK